MMRGEFFIEMHRYDTAQYVLLDAKKRYLQLNRPLDASDANYLIAKGHNQEKDLIVKEKGLAEALAQLKAQELEQSQTALKNTQTALHTTSQMLQLKDEFIEMLQIKIQQQSLLQQASDTASAVPNTSNLRQMKILTDSDWLLFRQRCDIHFPNLIDKLKTNHATLSSAEVRLFLMTKLHFDLGNIGNFRYLQR
jgi:hypothetical protein